MATLFAKSYVSDLTLGTGNYVLSPNQDNTYDNLAVTASVPASGSITYNFYTPANYPSSATAWGSLTGTAIVNITTAGASTTAAVAISRVNSAGAVQVQGTFGTAVATTATGQKTVTSPATALGTGAIGDRLLYQVKFSNSATSAKTVAFGLSDGIHDLVLSIPEYASATPATISHLSVYDSDNITPVTSSSATGSASGLHVDFDIVPQVEDESTVFTLPSVEVKGTGVTFANTATSTIPDIWYDADEPQDMRGSPVVWDSIQKRFLMYSGSVNATATEVNQLWELRLSSGKGKWRQLTPSGTYPAGMYQGGLAFDALNNQLVVVFGYTTTDTNVLNYVSFASSADGAWTARTPSGTAPAARSNIQLSTVTDYTNNCCYVVCGWGAAYYNGVYKLTFSTTTPGGTWSTIGAEGATNAPSIRRNAAAVLDTQNNRLLVFGGSNGTTEYNDLHAFSLSGNTWTVLAPTGTLPGIRELGAMFYDPVGHRALMTGGYQTAVANTYDEIWLLDTSTTNCAWTNISLATGQQPLGKYAHTVCFDPDDRVGIQWGGVDRSNDTQHQVLLFDMTETTPFPYGLAYNHKMRPMDAPSVTFNPDTGETLFIGGYSQLQDNTTIAAGGHLTDVFAYNPTSNTWRVATKGLKSFFHREGVMSAYDTVNHRVLIFGGLWGNGTAGILGLNDVWELKINANNDYVLRRMLPTGTPPTGRWMGVPAFDATNNRLIITMGNNGGSVVYNDTWALNLASGDGTWTQLTPTGTAPTAAWQMGYANNTATKRLYIAGGCTTANDASSYSTQFMYLDYSTTNCAWVTLTAAPVARRGWGCALDTTNNYLVFFGGFDGTSVYNTTYNYNLTSSTWSASVVPATSPAARRSTGMWYDSINHKIIGSHGRPVSGAWFGDTWQFTPNYTTWASSTWTNLNPKHAIRASIPVTGLANNTRYHWQSWIATEGVTSTRVASADPSFTLGTVSVNLTFTQPGISRIIPTSGSDYSDASPTVLPTTADGLSYAFTSTDYTNTATTDASYAVATNGTNAYNVFLFRKQNTDSSSNITLSWIGQASTAASAAPVTLQIYNYTSQSWETIATNSTAAASTDFTLSGTISTNVTNYYATGNWVTARVYQ